MRLAAPGEPAALNSAMPVLAFEIPQLVNLTVPETYTVGVAAVNNYPMQRTDFRLVQSVTNEILFSIRDIDRQPVTLADGEHLTLTITDLRATMVMLSRTLSAAPMPPNPANLYLASIGPNDTLDWELKHYRWSLVLTRADTSQVMLWTDQNYGPYSYLELTEGPVPGMVPAQTLDPATFVINNNINAPPGQVTSTSSALVGAAALGVSGGAQTFTATLAGFTGTIEIDGTLVGQPASDADWFEISTVSYTAQTGTEVINTVANALWLRVVLTTTSGSVSTILYKN